MNRTPIHRPLAAALLCLLAWGGDRPIPPVPPGGAEAPAAGREPPSPSVDPSGRARALAGAPDAGGASPAVSVLDFGAVGDGKADDYAAVSAALVAAAGKRLLFPAGRTFRCVMPDGAGFPAVGPGTVVAGEGDGSVLRIEYATTAYLNVFNLSSPAVTFRDLRIENAAPAGGSASIFLVQADRLKWERCRLIGNSAATDGVPTSSSFLWNLAGSATDFTVAGCEVAGWWFTLLKTNGSTAEHRRFRFLQSWWHDNATAHISLNSPAHASVFDDVVIAENTFGDQRGMPGGLGSHLGFASVSNVVVSRNRFTGTTDGEAIHVEERCRNVVLSDNVIELTSPRAGWGKGIALLDNDVGGTRERPRVVTITRNVVRRTGLADSAGIDLVWDATGTEPTASTSVTENAIEGFAVGVQAHVPVADNRIQRNVIRRCTTGIEAPAGSADIRDNTIVGSSVGVRVSGVVGPQALTDVATPAASLTDVATPAASPTGMAGLSGWSLVARARPLGRGELEVPLVPVGRLVDGRIRFVAEGGASPVRSGTVDVTYDGAALTQTVDLRDAPRCSTARLEIVRGDLVLRIFSSGAPFTGRFQVDFSGLHVWE